MATTTISAPDLTLLHSTQAIENLALWVTPLVAVQTATITGVSPFSPAVSFGVVWDGGITGVSAGQLVKIESSAGVFKTWAVVRKTPTTSLLYVSQTPIGSGGYPSEIERAIVVTDVATVYTHRPLWGLYSRIDGSSFYKQWDVAYTDQNEEPPPVANTGTWQGALLGAGASSAAFRLPRVGSNSSFAFGSETITAYLWTLPTGVTLQAGYATSDSVIEVDAVAGKHLVSLRVTDSEGKTHTAYTWLFVSDGTTGAALSESYAVTVSDRGQSPEGREISLTVTGTGLDDVLYPGAGVLMREWPVYGADNASLTEGVAIDTFVGYLSEIEMTHDGNIGTVTATVKSPYLYAAEIVQPPQSLTEKANPTNWTQMSSVLSNPRGLLYYAIKWHTPTLLDMHDFDAPYITPRRKEAVWSGGSLQDAMRYVAELIAGHVGSASDGTTVLRKNPVRMASTDRDNVATVIDWQDTDMQAPYQFRKRLTSALQEVATGAFAFDGTNKVKAWAVRKRWNQGIGKTTFPNFTVTVAEGLAWLKQAVGHIYAELSRPIEVIDATLTMNQDVLDPAYWLWCSLTIDSDYDAYAEGLSSKRFLVQNVSREYSIGNSGVLKTVTLSLQPETFGQPGEEVPYKKWTSSQLGGYSPYNPIIYTPYQQSGYFGGGSNLAIVDNNGNAAITFNYYALEPDWISLSPYLNGESVHDLCLNYNAGYFTAGTNTVSLWAVTSDDTTLNIWLFADILSSLTATLIHTLTMADSSCENAARIEHSETDSQVVVVAFKDDTGVKYTRSEDGGTTWGSTTRIGAVINDLIANANAPLGLALDDQKQLVSAPFASLDYRVYIAETASDSFNVLSNSESSEAPQPMIKISPDSTTAYVSSLEPLDNVLMEFDGSDPYTFDDTFPFPAETYRPGNVTSPAPSSEGIAAGGNPGNCFKWTGAAQLGGTFYVLLNFQVKASAVPFSIRSLEFDLWFDFGTNDCKLSIGNDISTGNLSSALKQQWIHIDWNEDIEAGFFPYTFGPGFSGVFQLLVSVATTPILSSWEVRLDNIAFQVGNEAKLYKVTSITGTDSWTEISPGSNDAPLDPHALSVDIIDNDVLNLYGGVTGDWYRSANAGTSYSVVDSNTDYRAFLTAGNAMILGRADGLDMVFDGSTVEAKTGNLALVWDEIGDIKRLVPF